VVHGFFRFEGIQTWLTGDSWEKSVDYTIIAPRGHALIERLRALSRSG
jgi:hypothetical protein